jgi:hypothetical protein
VKEGRLVRTPHPLHAACGQCHFYCRRGFGGQWCAWTVTALTSVAFKMLVVCETYPYGRQHFLLLSFASCLGELESFNLAPDEARTHGMGRVKEGRLV